MTPELDINDIETPVLDPLTQELSDQAVRYAEQWSIDRPFFAARSAIDRQLLLVGGSAGTDETTGLYIRAGWTIAPAKTIRELGDSFILTRDGVQLTVDHDYRGRVYYLRYVRIVDGRIIRMWTSQLGDQKRWQEARKRRIRLSENDERGYLVVL